MYYVYVSQPCGTEEKGKYMPIMEAKTIQHIGLESQVRGLRGATQHAQACMPSVLAGCGLPADIIEFVGWAGKPAMVTFNAQRGCPPALISKVAASLSTALAQRLEAHKQTNLAWMTQLKGSAAKKAQV